MSRNERHTVRLFHPSLARILYHTRALRTVIDVSGRLGNGDEVNVVLEYGGKI
jgi:hypothetical protein